MELSYVEVGNANAEALGLLMENEYVIAWHNAKGATYRVQTLYDALQAIPCKGEPDLVQFSNGNYGYVSDLGNSFEIVG